MSVLFKVPQKMHAVLLNGYGDINQLEYRTDVSTPMPREMEVLVRVGACGINNTDVNVRTRWYDRSVNETVSEDFGIRGTDPAGNSNTAVASWNQGTISFPRIQGAAVAGTIVAVGDGVAKERLGTRVLVDPSVRDEAHPLFAQLTAYLGADIDGGFAQYVAVQSANAHEVQTSLTNEELATFPCSYDTAEEMLVRTKLSRGELILITGASGGVGTALVQLSLLRGAEIVAVASRSKEARLRALGVQHFVAREGVNFKENVRHVVKGKEIDVLADVVGGQNFPDYLKVLRRGGRYATAGAIGGPIQPMDLRDLIYKDLEMFGITCPTRTTFAQVVRYINAGKLRPLVEKTYALEDLAQAQVDFVKRSHVGKYVVVP